MDLKKYDTIKIAEEDIRSLQKWEQENLEYLQEFKFALNEGIIHMVFIRKNLPFDVYVYFKSINENTAHIKYYTKTDLVVKHLDFSVTFEDEREVTISNHYADRKTTAGKHNISSDLTKDAVSVLHSTMAYMTYFKKDFKMTEEPIQYKEKRLKKLQKEAKYNPNNTIKFNRNIYSFNSATKFKNITKKMYERHIESWRVIGHWRQTKHKRVWIKPYKKGTGKTEPKIYDLKGVEI